MEEKLPKKYFSVDVETNGPHPLISSMLSIGACVVGDKEKTFYAELKPLVSNYDLETFKIGASGLKSLKDYDFSNFNPVEIMSILKEKGEEPKEVMNRFNDWINNNSLGFRPIFCATPVLFDGSFISHYFFKFIKQNPFGYTDINIKSMYIGCVNDLSANLQELDLRKEKKLNHNALDDAVQQAEEFYTTLVYMRQHQKV